MLVYYYLPQGYAGLNGRHIHGCMTGFPPLRISYREYLDNKEILEMAPFTPSYIENATGKPFPLALSFTIDTLKSLPYRTLQQMATYFEIGALMKHTRLIYALRKATRDL